MTKAPKSQLKEMVDQFSALGAQLIVFDSTCNKKANSHFQFTCQFTKTRDGKVFEGVGTGLSKKVAEHAACQQVLDLMKEYEDSQTLSNNLDDNFSQLRTSPMPPVVVSDPITLSPIGIEGPQLINNGKTYVIQSNSSLSQTTMIAADETQLDPPEILEKALKSNRIGQLGELCVKNSQTPIYTDTQWIGPDDLHRFKVTCSVDSIQKYGVAKVKMNAKKIAAFKVLQELRIIPGTDFGAGFASSSSSTVIRIKPNSTPNPQPIVMPARPVTKVTEKIVYYTGAKIGTGGTANVFEGYFEQPIRKAAIKICHKDIVHHEKNKELDIMRKINDPNVVTYYTTEDIGPQTYIVMELASYSLEDVITANSTNLDFNLLKKWCNDATNGLAVLHSLRIVHRDLKPSNVLIFNGCVAKLADFGISKELDSCTQGIVTEAARGTRIWMPTEGLTLLYTMTKGKHLFAYKENEVPLQIVSNILEYRPNWGCISSNDWTSFKNLLQAMICEDSYKRPESLVVLEHPFFWDVKKGLDYVLAVNNDLKNTQKSTDAAECKSEMVNMYIRFCNETKITTNWRSRLCAEVEAFMSYKDEMRIQKKGNMLQIKKYNEGSFLKLIEFIRDYYQHYEEWNKFEGDRLRQPGVFGADGQNYGPYFASRFPELTTILYTFFQEKKYQGLQLPDFYKLNQKGYFPKW